MNEKATDFMGCILTAMGMTQFQDKLLFWFSFASTILGLAITITKNIIIPLVKKAKNKQLSVKDVPETLDKLSDICNDIIDDGQLNSSNKSKE